MTTRDVAAPVTVLPQSAHELANDAASFAQLCWALLMPAIAARKVYRLLNPVTGKYDQPSKWWRTRVPELPAVPAAVLLYDKEHRTHVLVFDFDAKYLADGAAVVDREVALLLEWIRQAGGVAFSDRSTSGGAHVYVPLAHESGIRYRHLEPLLVRLQERFQSLDTRPLESAMYGCITVPGSRCREGGWRRLAGSLDDALAALDQRCPPTFVGSLIEVLDDQPGNYARPGRVTQADVLFIHPGVNEAIDLTGSGLRADDALPADLVKTTGMRVWMPDYITRGIVPPYKIRSGPRRGQDWTDSEARLSVLEWHARQGHTRDHTWEQISTDATYMHVRGVFDARKDGQRQFCIEWARAFDQARHLLTAATARKSASTGHRYVQKHTGGIKDGRWKLAAAARWILTSGYYDGRQATLAIAVLHAVAKGVSISKKSSMAYGGRWLAIEAGLLPASTVWAILSRMITLPGSPLRRLARFTIDGLLGDEYTLVVPTIDGREVEPYDWQLYGLKLDGVDPAWKMLGHTAWYVYSALCALDKGIAGIEVPTTDLVDATLLSRDAVEDALAILRDTLMVDWTYGTVRRTGRTVRQLDELTETADELRDEQLARYQQERATYQDFWALLTANGLSNDPAQIAALAEHDPYRGIYDDPEYLSDLLGRAPPIPDSEASYRPPAPSPADPTVDDDTADDLAMALLAAELGAVVVT